MVFVDTECELHKLFSKCTLTLDFQSFLLKEGAGCIISCQVKDGSIVLSDCFMPTRSFLTLFTYSKQNSKLLPDILNSTPGCLFGMIMLGKPQQYVATWRVIFGPTACIMSSRFLPVVHRFCIFWCSHQMYSATIAQSSSKYSRPYYLFRSLFPISCVLMISLCCSVH